MVSPRKYHKIINKHKMRDWGAISCNFDALERIVSLFLRKQSRQNISNQNKEEGRDGITLTDATVRGEKNLLESHLLKWRRMA